MPFILIIAYILIEIALFSIIGNAIGTLPMVILVVAGFFFGSYLIRSSGENVRASIINAQNHLNSDIISDTIARVFSGFLIILPGFFTDILGLLFLFKPTRKALGKLVRFRTEKPRRAQDDIIEGEVINDDPPELK